VSIETFNTILVLLVSYSATLLESLDPRTCFRIAGTPHDFYLEPFSGLDSASCSAEGFLIDKYSEALWKGLPENHCSPSFFSPVDNRTCQIDQITA
jgi:hypothetical protein